MGNTTYILAEDPTHKWVRSVNYHCDYCIVHNEYKTNKICTVDRKEAAWNREMYDRRIGTSKYVARIFSYSMSEDCRCSSKIVFNLELEYYVRLSNFATNHPQTIYLLLSLLYGYSELYKIVNKHFQIELDMIGVSADGEVRVWVNEDFTSNEFMYLEAHPMAQIMLIDRIFKLLLEHPGKFSLPVSFFKFIEEHSKQKTFVQTIVSIKKFARAQNIRIPLCIQSAKFMRSRVKKEYSSLFEISKPHSGAFSQVALNSIDKDTTTHESPRRHETQSPCPKFQEFLKAHNWKARSSETSKSKRQEKDAVFTQIIRNSVDESVRIYQPQQQQLDFSMYKSIL